MKKTRPVHSQNQHDRPSRLIVLTLGIFLGAFLLQACGSGGGNGSVSATPKAAATLTLNGIIEDPPIADALIYLEGKGQSVRSDAEGRFSLEILPESRGLGILRSQGGRDTQTGALFEDLSLATPLALFAEGESPILSPATTLVVAVMAQQTDILQAQNLVRSWLGLPDDLPVTRRPTEDPRMLRRTLFLSRLAQTLTPSGEAFAQIASKLAQEKLPPLFNQDTSLNTNGLAAFPVLAGKETELQTFHAALAEAGNNTTLMTQATRNHLFATALMEALEGSIAPADPLFQERRSTYAVNTALLAQNLSTREDAFADVSTMARFLRYALPKADLLQISTSKDSPSGYTVSGPLAEGTVTPQDLSRIFEDSQSTTLLAEILRTNIPYQVEVPLLAHEHPKKDNAKRLHYYFNSNLSPVLQAERLVDRVYDDLTRDGVLAQVVRVKAKEGFFDEATHIIRTRMYDDMALVSAQTYLAQSLASWKRETESRTILKEAEKRLLERMTLKGNSVDTEDLQQFVHIQTTWAKLQDSQAMQALLKILRTEFLGQNLNFSSHSRLAMTARSTVDALLAEYPPQTTPPLAPELVAGLHVLEELAASTPPNENVKTGQCHYKLRIYMLVETALRYAEAGLSEEALRIIGTILSLREKDNLLSDTASGPQALNLTFGETHAYMPDVAALLFSMNRAQEALDLAASIPTTSTNSARYRARAFAEGADYHVRHGDLNMAMTFVEDYVRATSSHADETLAEKIRFLTYETSDLPRGAEILLQKGDKTGAGILLEKALFYADQMEGLDRAAPKDWVSRQLTRGYARIAPLLVRAGQPERAKRLLTETRSQITPAFSPVDALEAWRVLAKAFDACEEPLEADLAFDHAVTALKNQFGTRKTLDVMKKGLELLSDLTGSQRTETAKNLALFLSPKAEDILDEAGEDADTLNTATKDTAKLRVSLAEKFREAGWPDLERMELDTAYATALAIFNENDRMEALTSLAEAYALAKALQAALRTADQIPFLARKNAAYLKMGTALALYDAFPGTPVALVDTDGDGKPDFFHPLATEEEIRKSGLEMDLDCDGDGIPDVEDPTPLYRNP